MSFAETNDNVAGVEATNRKHFGPPVPSLGGVELTPDGIDRALDSYLIPAIRASGRVEPGQEAAAVERLRTRFTVVLSAAGTTGITAKSGRPFAEEVAEALTQARPTPPRDPFAPLRTLIAAHQARTNPFIGFTGK